MAAYLRKGWQEVLLPGQERYPGLHGQNPLFGKRRLEPWASGQSPWTWFSFTKTEVVRAGLAMALDI